MDNLVSRLCSYMGIFALVQTFLPPTLREWLDRCLDKLWEKLFPTADPYVQLEIEERGSSACSSNIFYREVAIYLSSLRTAMDLHTRLKVFRADVDSSLSFSLPDDETLEDSFNGAPVWWTHACTEKEKGDGNNRGDERKSFTLKFMKNDRGMMLPSYLDHVTKVAGEIERENTQRYLYTNNTYGGWDSTPLNHPASFETLALDDGLADRVKSDLNVFSQGEDFYHRNGRAWKRGYLLYGPPGTGKSTMIAAIANHLHFDIYDLELTKVFENAELKSLLMGTTRKSIIVIEDIDCTVQFPDRMETEQTSNGGDPSSKEASASAGGSRLTLSGLLNFTDGLWSSCGEERIFIFTTNHRDRLDPALLRPGRMDMHILLSYCSFPAFKKMARNYLGIQHHKLYPELEKVMEGTSHQVTPATLAEIFTSNQKDPDMAIEQVIAAVRDNLLAQEDPSTVDSKMVQEDNVGNKKELFLKKQLLKRAIFSLMRSRQLDKQTERAFSKLQT